MNSIIKKISILFLCISILGCKSIDVKPHKKLELKFLDEYILPEAVMIDGTVVGGLSGIDYYNGLYYLVCDDAFNPRFYEATITISDTIISNIEITKVVKIRDSSKYLDLEAIRYDSKTNKVFLTSEGHIKNQKQPLFFNVNTTGKIDKTFNIPLAFYPNSEQQPRHNATLEGLSKSYNEEEGYWITMELPLKADGPEPQLVKTKSPVRITYINTITNETVKQFAYLLDPIAKQPKNKFAVNGLTDILEYGKNKFFVIERSYSSGLGNQSNTIKLFNVDATKATNTLKMDNLITESYVSGTKTLLLDFEQLRDKLTNNSIDNIEGITFGPTLSNGNKTLLLISDNNFNRFEKQLNQFILLEIVD
ncbi:MAG: esterase-like activity of phytase family protein [Flavobacteriaceae bacterium]|nr:esterase-like activity of phytase family protein [Flavobacteriaceae bacterium]